MTAQPDEHTQVSRDPNPPVAESGWQEIVQDARRYRRLQILGCAPMDSKNLKEGTVLRFSNLDEFVDRDLNWSPSRGEAKPLPAPPHIAKKRPEVK